MTLLSVIKGHVPRFWENPQRRYSPLKKSSQFHQNGVLKYTQLQYVVKTQCVPRWSTPLQPRDIECTCILPLLWKNQRSSSRFWARQILLRFKAIWSALGTCHLQAGGDPLPISYHLHIVDLKQAHNSIHTQTSISEAAGLHIILYHTCMYDSLWLFVAVHRAFDDRSLCHN